MARQHSTLEHHVAYQEIILGIFRRWNSHVEFEAAQDSHFQLVDAVQTERGETQGERHVRKIHVPHGKVIPNLAGKHHTAEQQRPPVVWRWKDDSVGFSNQSLHVNERENDGIFLHLGLRVVLVEETNHFLYGWYSHVRATTTIAAVFIAKDGGIVHIKVSRRAFRTALGPFFDVGSVDPAHTLNGGFHVRIDNGGRTLQEV